MCIRDSFRIIQPVGDIFIGIHLPAHLGFDVFTDRSDIVLSLIHIQMCIRDRGCDLSYDICPAETLIGDLSRVQKIYLVTGRTDMRKSFDGLMAVIRDNFQMDPFSNALFLFCGRKKNTMKALYFDRDGFVPVSYTHLIIIYILEVIQIASISIHMINILSRISSIVSFHCRICIILRSLVYSSCLLYTSLTFSSALHKIQHLWLPLFLRKPSQCFSS